MPRSPIDLRADALRIWQAGLDGVHSERLMRDHLRVDAGKLITGKNSPEIVDLKVFRRIAVVGAGKAGAGMAAALEGIFGQQFLTEKQLTGWVNVPADCMRKLQRIHLHAAPPTDRQ